jgi:hypothetical protein
MLVSSVYIVFTSSVREGAKLNGYSVCIALLSLWEVLVGERRKRSFKNIQSEMLLYLNQGCGVGVGRNFRWSRSR